MPDDEQHAGDGGQKHMPSAVHEATAIAHPVSRNADEVMDATSTRYARPSSVIEFRLSSRNPPRSLIVFSSLRHPSNRASTRRCRARLPGVSPGPDDDPREGQLGVDSQGLRVTTLPAMRRLRAEWRNCVDV